MRKKGIFTGIDSLPHMYQIVAVVFISGAFVSFAYGLSTLGLTEVAASFLSFYVVFVGQRVLVKAAGSREVRHFRESSALLGALYRDVEEWLTDRKLLALCIIGLPVTVAFVLFKTLVVWALGIFTSVWVALAVGLLVAGAVTSPLLVRRVRDVVFADGGDGEAV